MGRWDEIVNLAIVAVSQVGERTRLGLGEVHGLPIAKGRYKKLVDDYIKNFVLPKEEERLLPDSLYRPAWETLEPFLIYPSFCALVASIRFVSNFPSSFSFWNETHSDTRVCATFRQCFEEGVFPAETLFHSYGDSKVLNSIRGVEARVPRKDVESIEIDIKESYKRVNVRLSSRSILAVFSD